VGGHYGPEAQDQVQRRRYGADRGACGAARPMLTLGMPPRITAAPAWTPEPMPSRPTPAPYSQPGLMPWAVGHRDGRQWLRLAYAQGTTEARYKMSMAAMLAGMSYGTESAGAVHAMSQTEAVCITCPWRG